MSDKVMENLTCLPVQYNGMEWSMYFLQPGGEPLAKDLDVAAWLGYRSDGCRQIRRLIERHFPSLGEVCVTMTQTSPKGGRPGKTYLLTEEQALFIAAKSDTPHATDVLKTMIAVFVRARRIGATSNPETRSALFRDLVNNESMMARMEQSEALTAARLDALAKLIEAKMSHQETLLAVSLKTIIDKLRGYSDRVDLLAAQMAETSCRIDDVAIQVERTRAAQELLTSIARNSSPRRLMDHTSFFQDMCEFGDDARIVRMELFSAYIKWCSTNAVPNLTPRLFTRALRERGITPTTMRVTWSSTPVSAWRGIRLCPR